MTMNAVIRRVVQVDANHAVHLTDKRPLPGQTVQIVVSEAADAANSEAPSLLALAAQYSIDAPADYSVNFEQVLR
jgi:hypothetical protein